MAQFHAVSKQLTHSSKLTKEVFTKNILLTQNWTTKSQLLDGELKSQLELNTGSEEIHGEHTGENMDSLNFQLELITTWELNSIALPDIPLMNIQEEAKNK